MGHPTTRFSTGLNLPQVIANDKGEVVVRPRGMWEGEPVHGKLAGPNSSMPPNCEQPDLLVGTYTFDCLKGVMESEDTDRNRFVLDVTKTTFLREDFSISREGGSTADGATSPTSPKEKAEKSKRSSSRPSSGKVGMTQRGHGSSSQCHTVLVLFTQLCYENELGNAISSFMSGLTATRKSTQER